MANILGNGDIIPSQYGIKTTPFFDSGSYFGNIELRRGEITKIIYPDEDESVSKKFIEYDIYLEIRRNGTGNCELLNNVVLFNLLGSLADRTTWTLRPADKPVVDKNKKEAIGNGSKVLVMFIHGEGKNPVILGGLRDPNDDTEKGDKKSEAGHFYEQIFNGLSTEIDKNGAFTITFNGPTKNDGKLDEDKVKKEATGTYIQIDKDGNLKTADKDDKNYHQINHKDSKIKHLADKEYHVEVSNGKITTKSNGVEHGSATDAMVLGTTYRNAENQMHTKITASLQFLQSLVTVAASNMTTASTLITIPVTGGTLAGPSFAAAAIAMTSMPSAIAQLVSAINAMEGQSDQYVSRKNKLD